MNKEWAVAELRRVGYALGKREGDVNAEADALTVISIADWVSKCDVFDLGTFQIEKKGPDERPPSAL